MATETRIGPASAYALACKYGYQGTEAEWATDQANCGKNAAAAKESASSADLRADAALKSANDASEYCRQAREACAKIESVAEDAKSAHQSEANAKASAEEAASSKAAAEAVYAKFLQISFELNLTDGCLYMNLPGEEEGE